MSYVTKQSKVNMKAAIISLFTFLSISCCYGDQVEEANTELSHFIADLWLEGADVIKVLWRDCSKKLVDVKDVIDHREYFPKFVRCMKRKTLRALDRSLSTDVVPIFSGINLVRYELVDRSGNILPDNDTSTWTENELEKEEWRALALKRIAKVLRTHVIKFELEDEKTSDKGGTVEFRGKRRHHMMTMMLFGIVSIGMVLVPTGFQFLAVLGGKALVLAKMALILASIQGLKKLATNPVNYGYYHYPPYEQIERRSDDDWFLPSVTKETLQPVKPSRAGLNPGNTKTDKIDKIEHKDTIVETKKTANIVTWKPELPKAVKSESEPRVYPVYYNADSSAAVDSPNPLLDLTTKPGEVQADYSLDFPYNGFRYQSPTAIISA